MSEIRDYNGVGDWSASAVQERYLRYARSFGQKEVRELRPREHTERSVRWVYPVMERVIEGIKAGDPACVELGVEFIEYGGKQPFGRILHGNTARALRRASLSDSQVERLRARILSMLVAGDVPHEFREYAKLLRSVGVGPTWKDIVARVDRGNPYVLRHVQYFERHVVLE